jgi:hypothetical protein
LAQRNRLGSACTHLSQGGTDTLLGQAGSPLFLALLLLETLQRRQKPRRLWLAIDHGERSFRNSGAAISVCSCWLRPIAPILWFVGNMLLLSPVISYAIVTTGCQEFSIKNRNADNADAADQRGSEKSK